VSRTTLGTLGTGRRVIDDVIARRAGRIAFGTVLLLGTALLVQFERIWSHHGDGHTERLVGGRWAATFVGGELHAWHIIVGTWLAAIVAGLAVTVVVAVLPRGRDGDSLRKLALVVPSVGVAMLLPITLHMPFVLRNGAASFDQWCWLSMVGVGHTHIVFGLLVWDRAHTLANGGEAISIRSIYLLTCLLAAIPFIVPVVFVAITGIPFIPLLYWMKRIADADREASVDVPFAIARAP
jgi:hypothetical protein